MVASTGDMSTLRFRELGRQSVLVALVTHDRFARRLYHRKMSVVRRDVRFYLRPRGLDVPMNSFCRKHGLVDPGTGFNRLAESTRLLLYVAMMQNRPAMAAEGAVRANKVMLVGAMAKRLQLLFATSDHQPAGVRRGMPIQVHLILDDWLHQAMNQLARRYVDPSGVVNDMQMICDLMRQALMDPNVDRVAQEYQRRMEPIRASIAQIENQARALLTHSVGHERPIEELFGRTA